VFKEETAKMAFERANVLYSSQEPPKTPQVSRCLVGQATSLLRVGETERATILLRQAMHLTPGNPDIPFMLANTLYTDNQHIAARDLYRMVITVNPSHLRAWFNLGHALKALQKYNDAAFCFRRALKLNPRFYKARFMLAHVLSLLGRDKAAILEYEHTLRTAPSYIKAHYNLGNCHWKQGDGASALQCYRKVLRLDATYDKAWVALGQVAQRMDLLSLAQEAYSQALTLRPDLYDCRFQLGRLLEQTGDYQNAGLHYRVYLRDAPTGKQNCDVKEALMRVRQHRKAAVISTKLQSV
jgi:tetratricopeptide (TPR) repeat protein